MVLQVSVLLPAIWWWYIGVVSCNDGGTSFPVVLPLLLMVAVVLVWFDSLYRGFLLGYLSWPWFRCRPSGFRWFLMLFPSGFVVPMIFPGFGWLLMVFRGFRLVSMILRGF